LGTDKSNGFFGGSDEKLGPKRSSETGTASETVSQWAKTSSNGHRGGRATILVYALPVARGQCLAQPRRQHRSAQPWPRQSILGSWSQADNCCRQQRVEGIGSQEMGAY